MNQQTSQAISKKTVIFPNGNQAQLVSPALEAQPTEIINALDLELPKAVIMLAGGAGLMDENLTAPLQQLFAQGVVPVAQKAEALIIDGGTQAGVMEIMGQSTADRGHQTQLLGIAPAGKVTYPNGPAADPERDTPLDPNHSHFVLVDTKEWGGETDTMYNIAATLASNIPTITILVNGGGIAKQEVLHSVRQGWPVIVIQNSGRLADEIANNWLNKPDAIEDVVLAEIVNDGNIHLFKLENSPMALQEELNTYLDNPTLRDAWQRFADYDQNAVTTQRRFVLLRKWILGLGVAATFLAVLHSVLPVIPTPIGITVNSMLKYLVIATPIIVSMLVSGAAKFERGVSWVLLRNGAESIKKEIYRYRAQIEIYSPDNTDGTETREIKLARKIKLIGQRLMKTQLNRDSIKSYGGDRLPPLYGTAKDDDGFSDLTPADYLALRLEDQMYWYQKKAIGLDRQSKRLYWSIYILGGLGTFLAAIGLEIWIAVTVALTSTLTAFLEFRRVESTLITYNQTATDLESIRTWWHALPNNEKNNPENFEKLVKNTEDIIQSEHSGWVQEMQDALSELYSQTKSTEEAEDS